MADHTIARDEQGAYEIPIPADTPVTFTFSPFNRFSGVRVQVMVHEGTSPVYARPGNTITPSDPKASIIPALMFGDIHTASGTVTVRTAAPAIISVYRA